MGLIKLFSAITLFDSHAFPSSLKKRGSFTDSIHQFKFNVLSGEICLTTYFFASILRKQETEKRPSCAGLRSRFYV